MSDIDFSTSNSKKVLYDLVIQAYDEFLNKSSSETEVLEAMLASAEFEKQILKTGEALEQHLINIKIIQENKIQLEKTQDKSLLQQKLKITNYTVYFKNWNSSESGHFKRIFYVLPVKNLGPVNHIKLNEMIIDLDCQTSDYYGKDESYKIDTPKSEDYLVPGERGEESYIAKGFTGYHKITVKIIS